MINKLKYIKATIVVAFLMSADYIKSVTKLQAANWVLQFFCFRVYKSFTDLVLTDVKGFKFSKRHVQYGIMIPVVPLTGWVNNFWSFGMHIRHFRLTKWIRTEE